MRLCVWPGAHCLLPVLVLLTVLHVKANQHQSKERHYYIAAVEIDWNYSDNETSWFNPTYKKVVFREYEEGFRQAKTHPSWLGLLGPTLRAEEGDTIVVTFRNMAREPYSLHPHGVSYGKQSEGANYFDNTSLKEKEDDNVHPNREHVYTWEVTRDVSPKPNDPTCLTYTYTSHQDVVKDYNSGLIGALLVCKPGSLDESGKQVAVHQEYIFLFGVFDEKESKYSPSNQADNHVKYTINGYTKGSLPDVRLCAHASVSLHLLAMSSEPEVFSVHMNGQVLQQTGHKVSSVGLISGSTATASMVALYTGRWLLSSHTTEHMEAGMHAFVDVEKCDGFEEPSRRMTIAQRKQSREWKYYIAAEEVVWDYTPNLPEHVDEDFKLQYLKQSSTRIGGKYKKVVYTLYKNESFTERLLSKQRRSELGILGPVIRAQIRDVIKIVFKNMASRPYSIYPHGLTIEKSAEGVNYPEGGNHSHGVQPGETHTYVWRVVEEDEPLEGDSRCLTRMYHSAVDTPRDIASGLIGPILICKSQSLNVRNVQLKADKEQHAVFAVFDENKSWYLEDNIRQYCDRSKVNKADPDFYKSNIMHTINGYAFESGPLLGFCNGEVATWHVSSIGAQDYIQTATFYGHPFEMNERTEDILSLYPMTGESITMNMDNIGIWLLVSLNSHETTKGMRVKFRDVECYRDYQYNYEDVGSLPNNEFTEWKPPTWEDIKTKDELEKEKEKEKEKETETKFDDYTDNFAEELGLRSLRNQSADSDVEKLDLSFLDYGAVDVLDTDRNISLNVKETRNETKIWELVNSLNFTGVSDIENTAATVYIATASPLAGNVSPEPTSLSAPSPETSPTEQPTKAISVTAFSAESDNPTTSSLTALLPDSTSPTVSLPESANVIASTVITLLPEPTNLAAPYPESTNLTASNLTTTSQESTNLTASILSTSSPESTNLTASNFSTSSPKSTNLTASNLTTSSPESTKLSLTMSRNLTSISETEMTTEDRRITVNTNFVEDYEERLTRGDVFSYSVHQSKSSIDGLNSSVSADASNHSLSTVNAEEVYISKMGRDNLVIFDLVSDSSAEESGDGSLVTKEAAEHGLQLNSSEVASIPTNSSRENGTNILLQTGSIINATVDVPTLDSLGMSSSENRENVSSVPRELTDSSIESISSEKGNLSIPVVEIEKSSSEELSASDSSEEVIIYLKGNNTEVIKTTSLKKQGRNWTYEVNAPVEADDIPDHMKKYFEETLQTTPPPKKKIKTVNLRQRPPKGKGLKTRKRKEYKPQARSGLPFSPRGFNPGMSPRGARPSVPQPVSDEEHFINMPVVIGVPRPDFSDYELYVPGEEPDHLEMEEQNVNANEYEYVMYNDPYSGHEDVKNLNIADTIKYLKFSGPNVKTYFIAAEEVKWDYAGYGQRRPEKSQQNTRETKFTKVVFRGYLDSSFSTPDIRGELDEHLGILGPLIKAEVGQTIMVVFRNNANRPYSIHPNGVSYTKQTEGLSYEDGSKHWYTYDNEVKPNTTFTYLWKVSSMVGPTNEESDCRTWAYYSGVNPEKDIHSGLIGPLLVCRKGTLERTSTDTREFTLLFMTFDESQSWYHEENREIMLRKLRRRFMDNSLKENLKFHSINGITYSLKGLRMYTSQRVSWHLINMGSPKDFQSVHFHGQTFLHKKTTSYRQAVYPLLPGSFATLEMYPSKPGLWQLETEVGFNQQKGMQTLFLVIDNECYHPLGLESGSVKDDQITAIDTRGHWEPSLARLNNAGKYNAWSTEKNNSWIQVDFQRPVVISRVETQGAKQFLSHHFVQKYTISYSNDRWKWIFYKGDSKEYRKMFTGNEEAYATSTNTFFPPIIARFVRLHPITWFNTATVRMEFYGCQLDGCSVPLGMENHLIGESQITASSMATSWYSGPWRPALARLNQQGTINAWRAKYNDMNQWLQVELPQIKKITGIITQGAKALGKEMYVTSYTVQYSNNGIHWNEYAEDDTQPVKIFHGNTNNNDHVKNYIFPPIFSRFIRIIPKMWTGSITMRIELLGCDFE
ncbi:coagulation factor V [Mugil cephalus]|uniref:coagulation factor V n=1 Tax=Mugil cephalus TaxID=48193 RepID=UPI001FB73BC2|nr:coagulation factor V [Mugil cephalus]